MLNLSVIKSAMDRRGLTGTSLAQACQVSKEAVSNWLSGDSIPRPGKLPKLAETLQLTVEQLFVSDETPEPIVAYRTKTNRPATGAALDAAQEVALHLRELAQYVEPRLKYEPRQLKDPQLEIDYVRGVAAETRASLGLAPDQVLTNEHLVQLFKSFGAYLVPVFWGLNKERHENALNVYIPESKESWVVFNLGCKKDDYKYWLAHEYAHCLSLHKLQDEPGEKFAERFAQFLLFPDEVAQVCLDEMQSAKKPMDVANSYAERLDISIVTVLKGVDRLLVEQKKPESGLVNQAFWGRWKAGRELVPSFAHELFGTDTPAVDEFIAKCEQVYDTPVFKALANLQRQEGGRNPAFIAAALKVGLGEAVGLSHALWQAQV
ncbi:MAG: helix-turn-helix domain-containing protein [Acidobacteriota bacterium]